jgi:20S proteasome subunit beta 7
MALCWLPIASVDFHTLFAFILFFLSASYGSLARFRDQQRLTPVGLHTIIGTSGDISDLQAIQKTFQEIQYLLALATLSYLCLNYRIEEYIRADGNTLAPWHYYEKLANIMYARRSKIDPLWNSHIVGGMQNGRK